MSAARAVPEVRLCKVCSSFGHCRSNLAACGIACARLVGLADLVNLVHVAWGNCVGGRVNELAVELRDDGAVDDRAIHTEAAMSNYSANGSIIQRLPTC